MRTISDYTSKTHMIYDVIKDSLLSTDEIKYSDDANGSKVNYIQIKCKEIITYIVEMPDNNYTFKYIEQYNLNNLSQVEQFKKAVNDIFEHVCRINPSIGQRYSIELHGTHDRNSFYVEFLLREQISSLSMWGFTQLVRDVWDDFNFFTSQFDYVLGERLAGRI
jgi:hypothetical protein